MNSTFLCGTFSISRFIFVNELHYWKQYENRLDFAKNLRKQIQIELGGSLKDLKLISLKSLEQRRSNASVNFVIETLNGQINAMVLLSKINFHCPRRNRRSREWLEIWLLCIPSRIAVGYLTECKVFLTPTFRKSFLRSCVTDWQSVEV